MLTKQAARPIGALGRRPWVCPSCTQTLKTPIHYPPSGLQQRRTLFNVPQLNFHEQFEKNGVSGLFSQNGYSLGWTAYQSLMIQKLNELTSGRHFEHKTVKDLALLFAHNPSAASTFNHASMAHNNHFFYQQFSTTPRRLEQYPELSDSLTNQFGSIDTLRTTFIDTAANMFGPGFVWLVWMREPEKNAYREGSWKILCTYNAGTPYPEAGFMQQGLDMNTNNASTFQQYKSSLSVGYMGQHSEAAREKARLPPGGTNIMPVLCVSTWEHSYIYDFGLAGKARYLNDFWDVVDWHVVNHRAPKEVGNALLDARRSSGQRLRA